MKDDGVIAGGRLHVHLAMSLREWLDTAIEKGLGEYAAAQAAQMAVVMLACRVVGPGHEDAFAQMMRDCRNAQASMHPEPKAKQ